MAYFLQQLVNGIALGSIYGLIAIGYTMVYGIIGMINFAHCDIFMVGAFIALIAFLLIMSLGLTLVPLALVLVLIVAMLLTAICEISLRDRLAAIILQETSSIGLRYYAVNRILLRRESKTVKTRYGAVTIKIVTQPDGTERAAPEYDDLKRIATAKRTTLKAIHDEVMRHLK